MSGILYEGTVALKQQHKRMPKGKAHQCTDSRIGFLQNLNSCCAQWVTLCLRALV